MDRGVFLSRARAVFKNLAIFEVPNASWLATNALHWRNVVPSPFDYPNHASNVSAGAAIGVLVGNVAAGIYTRLLPEAEQTPGRIRSAAAVCSALAGLAVNAAFETQTGTRLFHLESIAGTPDILDLVYGVGASAVAGAIAPTVHVSDARRERE